MASIYELTGDMLLLWNLMDSDEIEDETLIDAMMNSQEELSIKLDGYCKFIKNIDSDIEGIKAEEKRLAARRKTLENTKDRAKKAMQYAMTVAGEKKMTCGSFLVYLKKNPEHVVMDEQYIENIPAEYLKVKDPEIDKTKIKQALNEGKDLSGIAHLEQDESLQIK